MTAARYQSWRVGEMIKSIDGDVFRLVERVNHCTGDIVRPNCNPVQRLGSLAPPRITDLVRPSRIDHARGLIVLTRIPCCTPSSLRMDSVMAWTKNLVAL